MERTDILSKVIDIVNDVLGVDPQDISEETTFDDIDADSLDRLQLVTAMEDEFDVEIPDERLEAIGSVYDAVEAIEAALEA
ncbi:acyl carrier protein [Collinsella sp. AGMB00827]|uniref:Acyl carrier protein n=1 Tax=Collinsella ureilytica TaxID=2869515 RepID=A0ABS7MHH5_9ACTN|nr:acyl carrier protein [Collinsella urealyticum]MBY4796814.1 acyl carrier protein [Collinsella urealyticum]